MSSQMSTWKPRIAAGARYKHEAIAEALKADIAAGLVEPGAALPPQRDIARALGVDLTTVTRALNEVRRAGLIEARTGSGTFVRAHPPVSEFAAGNGGVDLSMNMPPQPTGLPRRIADGLNVLLAGGGSQVLSYQET